MSEADDEMFAGMIAAAINTPNAREISQALPGAPEPMADGRRVSQLCLCGSNQYAYNLFDHTGKLLMYCCHRCEKPRREQLEEDGKRLTQKG